MVLGGIVITSGATAAVGGTVTVAGAQLVNKCHNEISITKAQEAIDNYNTSRNKIVEKWKKIESICEAISIKVDLFGAEAIIKHLWYIYLNVNSSTNDIKGIAKTLAANVANIVVPPCVCLGVLVATLATGGLLNNICQILVSKEVVKEKKPHPAAVKIRENTIVTLEIEMEALEIMKESLKKKII